MNRTFVQGVVEPHFDIFLRSTLVSFRMSSFVLLPLFTFEVEQSIMGYNTLTVH